MWGGWPAVLLLAAFFVTKGDANGCISRNFGDGLTVCVCNATYCDNIPDNNPRSPERGSFYWYVSTKGGLRMSMARARFNSCNASNNATTLHINTTRRYQRIFGFGGAFTDSAGINIKKLSQTTQEQLLRTYYDPNVGCRYMLGRVPIGGTDFSTRPYTYDDHPNDTNLEHFALPNDDYDYKIPFMRRALQLNPKLRFLGSSWSAPPWMKTNNKINGFGFLKPEYYQLYAEYLVKFLNEYKKNGLNMWAITTGNEPLDAFVPFDTLNTMGWTPYTMGKWVADNLGPTLARTGNNQTLIFVLDDQRINFPWYPQALFRNQKARDYSSGIAIHWYADGLTPAFVLDETHNNFPEQLLLLTEAASGSGILDHPKVLLGSWDRGESYILSIIEYMNHWSIGWIDWNIALDKSGGPNWIQNYVDSPIIVNPETDEFFKQPMYYALAHFSRFVDRNSIRTSITDTDDIKSAAFLTPSAEVVTVLYNRKDTSANIVLQDLNKEPICLELPARSMNTIIYAQ